MNLRKFKLSCKYFAGFTCTVDLDNHDCMETIITEIKKKLACILKQYRLEILVDKLNKTEYHYHDYTFADTLIKEHTFYICSHCENVFKLDI
jgi:hypothetical protein